LEFLERKIPSKSLSYWQEALQEGRLTLNHQTLASNPILKSSDQLTHTAFEDAEPEIPTNIEILYEDDALLVINKPSGLPIHPCGRYHFHTFTKIAQEAWPELNLHPVHRLDAETSGILVLAKTPEAASNLAKQFENHNIQKTYLAYVNPAPIWGTIICDKPISERKGKHGRRFTDHVGLPAKTEFRHLGDGLVEAKPISGRTNQIRVHLAYLRHPIVGDKIYGGSSSERLHLHAWKIKLKHPLSECIQEFECSPS
jgi:RluA family pseudouridine synthase